MGRRIDMARGFDSVGSEVEVAYDTRALTISRSSSSDAGWSEAVADSITRAETWLMIDGKRCKARCCRIGEGVGAELVDEGNGRRDAVSSVEMQWIDVNPT